VTVGLAARYVEREVSASNAGMFGPRQKRLLSRENLALGLCGVEGQASLYWPFLRFLG
jgi:hypothetical protein